MRRATETPFNIVLEAKPLITSEMLPVFESRAAGSRYPASAFAKVGSGSSTLFGDVRY